MKTTREIRVAPAALHNLPVAGDIRVHFRSSDGAPIARWGTPEGLTANVVAPGPTETELFRANNQPGSEGEARYLAGIPIGRFGRPEEVAAAIAFLCSDLVGFITGQSLFVDGGSSLG